MICKLCRNFITKELTLVEVISFKALKRPLLCTDCISKFSYIGDTFCPQCSRYQEHNQQCNDCLWWSNNNRSITNRALFRYDKTMKMYMQAYKYQYDFELAQVFKAQFTSFLKEAGDVIYVPIPVKSTQRGFNQVTALMESNLITIVDALAVNEIAFDQKQAQRNRYQRVTSQQPFYLNQALIYELKNKKIVIVDDIYTTGTTIRQAADLLAPFTVHKIASYTLCR